MAIRPAAVAHLTMNNALCDTCLLSTTYFGPVQWYQKLYRYDTILIEQHEAFSKQTYRNRCLIATTQGIQALTIPIEHSDHSTSSVFDVQSIRISDHGNWRHLHWQAIQSAYGESPFFEYYEDDLRPFFTNRDWERLIDFNDAICQTMCQLLDIHPHIERTTQFTPNALLVNSPTPLIDFREVIHPKHPQPDADFTAKPYYQVYRQRHGFLPNLSILDLLFNMGPESIYYL